MKKQMQEDEFMRRRRARQRKIRKRRLMLALLGLIFVLAAVCTVLCFTVFFPIQSLTASGSEHYTPEEILASSGLDQGDNLFAFSDRSLAEKIKTALPYIETVKVKRSLPDRVRITVTDAAEYACYVADGTYYTVSKSEKVLRTDSAPTEGLFEIRCGGVTGEPGKSIVFQKEKTGQTVKKLIGQLENQKIPINYVDVTDPVHITAKIDGRFLVELGSGNYLEKKIAHLAGMLKNIEAEKTGRIDLSMWTSTNPQGTLVEGTIDS